MPHINFPRDTQNKMSITYALLTIVPTYGVLKFSKDVCHATHLLRTICLYKWNMARDYLKLRPTVSAVQVGHHISKWEWWVIRTDIGYIQCTLFNGTVITISPFTEDTEEYDIVHSPPVVSPIPVTF
jgi:hypothetical protein